MDDLSGLLAYLLSGMGLTVLIVWPQAGPGAWLRDRRSSSDRQATIRLGTRNAAATCDPPLVTPGK